MTAQTTERLRGVIKKTFHGKRYRERISLGEELPCDCGFISVSGVREDYFVNIAQVSSSQKDAFVEGKQVEFTPVPGAGSQSASASRVTIL